MPNNYIATVQQLGPVDTQFSNVVLLIAGNGAVGSDPWIDSSNKKKTGLVATGSGVISNAKSKWGGNSIYLPGSINDRYVLPADPDFDIGGGDMTFECWINPDALEVVQQQIPFALDGGTAANPILFFWNDGTVVIRQFNTSGSIAGPVAHGMTNGNWYHIAWTRFGNVYSVWINGVFKASVTMTTIPSEVKALRMFAGFKGYVSDIRVTKTVARYTGNGNFTPPAARFPTH